VKGTTTAGRMLWIRNATRVNISNWLSVGGTDGIRLADCTQVNLDNVITDTGAADGVRLSACTNASLNNVQGHNFTGTGVKTDSDCTDVIVLGCQATGNTAAQSSIGGTNVKPATITDFNIF